MAFFSWREKTCELLEANKEMLKAIFQDRLNFINEKAKKMSTLPDETPIRRVREIQSNLEDYSNQATIEEE